MYDLPRLLATAWHARTPPFPGRHDNHLVVTLLVRLAWHHTEMSPWDKGSLQTATGVVMNAAAMPDLSTRHLAALVVAGALLAAGVVRLASSTQEAVLGAGLLLAAAALVLGPSHDPSTQRPSVSRGTAEADDAGYLAYHRDLRLLLQELRRGGAGSLDADVDTLRNEVRAFLDAYYRVMSAAAHRSGGVAAAAALKVPSELQDLQSARSSMLDRMMSFHLSCDKTPWLTGLYEKLRDRSHLMLRYAAIHCGGQAHFTGRPSPANAAAPGNCVEAERRYRMH